jgi:hypothetical protein
MGGERVDGQAGLSCAKVCHWACVAQLAHLLAEMIDPACAVAWRGPPSRSEAVHPMHSRASPTWKIQSGLCNCNSLIHNRSGR